MQRVVTESGELVDGTYDAPPLGVFYKMWALLLNFGELCSSANNGDKDAVAATDTVLIEMATALGLAGVDALAQEPWFQSVFE